VSDLSKDSTLIAHPDPFRHDVSLSVRFGVNSRIDASEPGGTLLAPPAPAMLSAQSCGESSFSFMADYDSSPESSTRLEAAAEPTVEAAAEATVETERGGAGSLIPSLPLSDLATRWLTQPSSEHQARTLGHGALGASHLSVNNAVHSSMPRSCSADSLEGLRGRHLGVKATRRKSNSVSSRDLSTDREVEVVFNKEIESPKGSVSRPRCSSDADVQLLSVPETPASHHRRQKSTSTLRNGIDGLVHTLKKLGTPRSSSKFERHTTSAPVAADNSDMAFMARSSQAQTRPISVSSVSTSSS